MSGPFVRRDVPVTSAVLHLDSPIPFTGHDKRAPPCFGGTCLSGPFVRRDLPVTSAVLHLDSPIPFTGHDKRAPPKHPSEGPACQVRLFGGTCLSRPPFCIWIIQSHSTGHDKRAPPIRRDIFGGTCLSRPPFHAGQSIPSHRARQACPSDSEGHFACQVRLFGGTCLSRPPFCIWIVQSHSPGTTSVPLRNIRRRDLLVRSVCSEGPACHVRRFAFG
ncbi:MAG: hypothetical protein KatS3mg112_0304 [Thermogutta sp.]|nr:MAG: hypothetical protein KatS3mg112_0304 [Thermogutta sp.]